MTDLRYPIGKFEAPKIMTAELRNVLISQIAEAPRNCAELSQDSIHNS